MRRVLAFARGMLGIPYRWDRRPAADRFNSERMTEYTFAVGGTLTPEQMAEVGRQLSACLAEYKRRGGRIV